jgi:hypothetical protein
MCFNVPIMETKRADRRRIAVSIYLRPSLIARLEVAANEDGRSVSNFIERAVEAKLHRSTEAATSEWPMLKP